MKKLKLIYVEVIIEVVVKVGEEVAVEARAQLLVRRVGGWLDKTKLMLNSALNSVEVEVEAELGKTQCQYFSSF